MDEQNIIDLTVSRKRPFDAVESIDSSSGTADPTAPPAKLPRTASQNSIAAMLTEMERVDKATAHLRDWPCSPDWPGVPEIGRALGIQYITAVDPGEVHMGVVRFQLYPTFEPTHWKIVNLHELAELRNTLQPEIFMPHSTTLHGGEKRFGTREVYQALIWYLVRELAPGGLFDSGMLFVESQDFRRDMKGIELCLISVFTSARNPIRVLPIDGGSRPSGQTVSGNSAKSCYGGLFPSVAGYTPQDEYEEEESSSRRTFSASGRSRHGYSDVQTTSAKKHQYASNKRNSKIFGPQVAHIDNIKAKLGAALSAEDYANMQKHMNSNKTDDIYDAMFIGLYAINSHLYHMYRYQKNFTMKPIQAVRAPPLRSKRQFEELYEFMCAMGTSASNIAGIRRTLFRVPADGDDSAE